MKIPTLLLAILMSSMAACSTTPEIVLKFTERRYRPCAEGEMERFRPKSTKITFCWRYCARYKRFRTHVSKNCALWKTDVLDTESDFKKIRDAGFVLLNEGKIDGQ